MLIMKIIFQKSTPCHYLMSFGFGPNVFIFAVVSLDALNPGQRIKGMSSMNTLRTKKKEHKDKREKLHKGHLNVIVVMLT